MIEYNGSEDGRDIPQKWRRKKANGGSNPQSQTKIVKNRIKMKSEM